MGRFELAKCPKSRPVSAVHQRVAMSTVEELQAQLADCQAELAASKEEYEEFVESSKELEGMLQSDLDVAEQALTKEKKAREKAEQDKRAVQDRFSKETRQFADEIEELKNGL